MSKILMFIGASAGGSAGWWIGAHVGIMTAFFVSVLGSALGLYGAHRFTSTYL